MLSCALAVLAARGDHDIASLSLFATFDYLDTGPISVFVDEQLVAYRERTIGGHGGKCGLFRGEDMGNTFSLLRPNELWWNYNVEKYLKRGKTACTDLLFEQRQHQTCRGPCIVGTFAVPICRTTSSLGNWICVVSRWICAP